MEAKKLFAVVGTDARQAAAGRVLERAGYAVGGAEQVALADYILLPLPLDAARTPLAELLRAAKPDSIPLDYPQLAVDLYGLQCDAPQLAQLPAVQLSILNNVSAYVRPGGVLVYATCTVLPEENGGVVSAFLDVHPDFAKEEFTLPGIGSCPGDVTLWPQRTGTDGFYICRMRRRG